MDSLRQLIRYEIPGLLTIIYFLMLLYPVLIESSFFSCFEQFSKSLPGVAAVAVILALPIGFLLYQFYTFVEHKNFLDNRIGMKVVPLILEGFPDRKNWWCCEDRDTAEKNEVLDIAFYMKNGDSTNLARILERFESFYHSRRVVGIYVPSVSSLMMMLAVISTEYNATGFSCRFLISIVLLFPIICIFLFLRKKWERIDKRRYYFFILILIVLFPIALTYLSSIPRDMLYVIFCLLIFIISLVAILPTVEKGFLRREIEEFETNILLARKEEISAIICKKIQMEKLKKEKCKKDKKSIIIS